MGNLISVIVPVCDVAPYLGRCIDSILSGTYEELEVILVDDASTDGSGEICDSYAARDPRVRVLHTEKKGGAAARNSGLDLAKGDFISFVDSDDYIHPETISKLYQAIAESGASMSVCSYVYVNEGARKKFDNKGIPINDKIFRTDKILREELFKPYHTYWIATWAKLYRAELWSGIRFPVGKVFEDLYTLPLIYMACETCACVGLTGYYYMQHAGSILNAMNPKKTADHIEGTFFLAEQYSRRDDLRGTAYLWMQRGLWEFKSLCAAEKKKHGTVGRDLYVRLVKSFRRTFRTVGKCPIPAKQRVYMLLHYLLPGVFIRHQWKQGKQ